MAITKTGQNWLTGRPWVGKALSPLKGLVKPTIRYGIGIPLKGIGLGMGLLRHTSDLAAKHPYLGGALVTAGGVGYMGLGNMRKSLFHSNTDFGLTEEGILRTKYKNPENESEYNKIPLIF